MKPSAPVTNTLLPLRFMTFGLSERFDLQQPEYSPKAFSLSYVCLDKFTFEGSDNAAQVPKFAFFAQ